VRRGAAWPAERPSSWLVVREAVSRWQVAHRRAVMVAKRRRRCPQDTVGWPSARPLGMVALEVRMPAVPSSACRCPRPASGVQCLVRVSISTRPCPRGRCPVSSVGVRCPVSSVGCPVSVGSRVHRIRPGGCGGGRWAGSRMAGMAGVGVVALPCPRPVGRRPSRSLAVEAGPGRAGQRRGRLGLGRRSWAVVGQRLGRPPGRPGLAGWAGGIARWWRAGVRSEAATTLGGHRVRPRAESSGRCEPPGLDCDLRVRPWCGRSLQ
jgi:hypothetical protein